MYPAARGCTPGEHLVALAAHMQKVMVWDDSAASTGSMWGWEEAGKAGMTETKPEVCGQRCSGQG